MLTFASWLYAQSAAAKNVLVYYDPDANFEAIVSITKQFNKFLSNEGVDLTFQPVQSSAAFERLVKKSTTTFAIVSSDYLTEGSPPVELTPLLVPSSGGDASYRKLLVDRGSGKEAPDLTNKRIVTTVSGSATEIVQDVLRRAGIKSKGITVITVSKDIDALLALSYDTADAAVVSPGTLAVHKRLQPKAAAALRIVFQTDKVLRSPFCVVAARASKSQQEKVVAALRKMASDKTGRDAILAMGFDDWVTFKSSMLEP